MTEQEESGFAGQGQRAALQVQGTKGTPESGVR